jgi:hypothetical protein
MSASETTSFDITTTSSGTLRSDGSVRHDSTTAPAFTAMARSVRVIATGSAPAGRPTSVSRSSASGSIAIPVGAVFAMSASFRSASARTASMSALGRAHTIPSTTSSPRWSITSQSRGAPPRATVATSLTRTGASRVATTTTSPIAAMLPSWPIPRMTNDRSSRASPDPPTFVLAFAIADAISADVTLCAESRDGSSVT